MDSRAAIGPASEVVLAHHCSNEAARSGTATSLTVTSPSPAPVSPVAAQPWYREVIEERDPERRLRLNARNSRVVKTRIGALLRLIRSAAPLDADIEALWNHIQTDFYDNQRAIVQELDHTRSLRPGLDVARATDILWTLNHPDVWQLLVGERGWTPERYEQWFGDTACAQLLRRDPSHHSGERR
jgi:hypothetical protein